MPALRHTGAANDHGRHLKRTNNNACDTFHDSAAAVFDGCDALHVILSNSHQPSSILVSTGTRLPAHVTAMGRVLLASLARIAELLRQIKLNQLAEKSETFGALCSGRIRLTTRSYDGDSPVYPTRLAQGRAV
jgi:DNA-binding IclR family transcriptional regulator